MKFWNRVSVTTHLGRHLYSVSAEGARALFDRGAVCVSAMRRKYVLQLTLLPNGLEMIGAAKGSAMGGGAFAVREHLVDGAKRTGHRVFRHRNEIILDYPDAFLDVAKGIGARVAEDPAAEYRRTCLPGE